MSVARKIESTSEGRAPMKSLKERSSRKSSIRFWRSAAFSPGLSAAMAAYRRTARRSRIPARIRAARERGESGRRNGYVSTLPLATIRPPSATAARRPGTSTARTPTSSRSLPVAEATPPKTWAPKLSHTSPRASERMRPPTRSSASSASTSRSRRCQAAASPAMPPPTTITSRVPGVAAVVWLT